MDQSESNSCENSQLGVQQTQILLLPPSTTDTSEKQLDRVSLDEEKQTNRSNSILRNYISNNDMELDNTHDKCHSPIETNTRKRKRYGSGLGNLGNTCFMNSTLQCLSHTVPLRQYFITREYLKHLNKDNPLGTGGELASEFAELLSEMWGIPKETQSKDTLSRARTGYDSYESNSYESDSVVYPRDFKFMLGKHAEQFVGYDQHDSQELMTYLLDTLHEDTNRVSKKPYIEKPEQGENEPDHEAAGKAWNLHLKREDSQVLENFMGQVKSRVQCPNESCGKVSTTFDPFMYLSVPIPGATDRTLSITFVPMNPNDGAKKINVTLNKLANMSDLKEKIVNVECLKSSNISQNNIILVEIWNGEVYSFYNDNDNIDKIRESDKTLAYEVAPHSSMQDNQDNDSSPIPDIASLRMQHLLMEGSLEGDGEWEETLKTYLKDPVQLERLLSKQCLHDDRLSFHHDMVNFLGKINVLALDSFDDSICKKEENGFNDGALTKLCETSNTFNNGISTVTDVAKFELCCSKLNEFFIKDLKERKERNGKCTVIQVVFRKNAKVSTSSFQNEKSFGLPIIYRISSTLTVYGLRKLLEGKIFNYLKMDSKLNNSLVKIASKDNQPLQEEKSFEMETSCSVSPMEQAEKDNVPPTKDYVNREIVDESNGIFIMNKIPLTYDRKSHYNVYSKTAYRKLGMLEMNPSNSKTAILDNDCEQERVFETVGKHGKININWPADLLENFFDEEKWIRAENESSNFNTSENKDDAKSALSVSKCISKYCQIEQLEESDMWYCDQCKEHVRAWKQCHLYRSPPILIVHLKRFHFSAVTHRRDKIDTLIDFPLKNLDLTDEVNSWEDGEEPIYDCYAVSNHYGGLGGGHYTAHAQNDDGEWCHFDDSRVTTNVNEKEVISPAAYVLYYKRRNLKVDEMSTNSLTSIKMEHTENDLMSSPSLASSSVPNSPSSRSMEGEIKI